MGVVLTHDALCVEGEPSIISTTGGHEGGVDSLAWARINLQGNVAADQRASAGTIAAGFRAFSPSAGLMKLRRP